MSNSIIESFFALLRAGLWEQSVQMTPFQPLDLDAIFRIADEQSVVGLVAAGLDNIQDRKITKQEALPFLKRVFSIESRNNSMNEFLGLLIKQMQDDGIYALLVKGQGVAQCYARPLWRSSGDIDLLLNSFNYERAKSFLSKKADSIESEGSYTKHLGMMIDSWSVELHGTLRSGLSKRIDRVVDSIQASTFESARVRCWRNEDVNIFLPSPDDDSIFVFIHFIMHFYKGGIGLRQLCDWCRLLWTYRTSIDQSLLERRLYQMRLLSEWKAFAAFAVDSLGMPVDSIPLYDSSTKWARKALIIRSFVLKVGNLGHNRDMSYYQKYPYLVRKTISFVQRCADLVRHAAVFPMDSVRFFPRIVFNGLRSVVRGE